MNLKIMHVDDEPLARAGFKTLINDYFPEAELVHQAANILEGIQFLLKSDIDILFLDIQLGNNSGFDLLETLPVHNFKIVFVTAFENYAIQAIKSGAFDYLVKPLDINELEQTFEKFKNNNSKDLNEYKLYINDHDSIEIVNINNITHLKSDNNYCHIFLESGKSHLSSKSLSYYSQLLPESNFTRVHQSYLVNMDKVVRMKKEENGTLVMKNKMEVPISRRRKVEVGLRLKN